MDAVLEEGAANLEELKVIWGDPDEALDFDGFCLVLSPPASAVSAWYRGVTSGGWYNDVLKLYVLPAEFLGKQWNRVLGSR